MPFRHTLLKSWKKPNVLTGVLKPLSTLYKGGFSLRKMAFEKGLLKSYTAPVPVIVVGNLTVGGTGKTPLVTHLVEQLRAHGFKPGVISRGYSGSAPEYPLFVRHTTPVAYSGDEAALIRRRGRVPVMVGSNRKASIEALLDEREVNVIVSDDGLQHLALERDIEICMIDDTSTQENEFMLPAGPYREPLTRLMSVDFIVRHGGEVGNASNQFSMSLVASEPKPVMRENKTKFEPRAPIHALAGIGNPQRFFDTCKALGYTISEHEFPDHHHFSRDDINFANGQVLMTEKDAVKCRDIATDQHWYLPVDAKLSVGFTSAIVHRLAQVQEQKQRLIKEG